MNEIDGIGRRGEKNEYADYWNSVVNKLLELLDGTTRSDGLIIVGATNGPDVIDPALKRLGRLETHIEIPCRGNGAELGCRHGEARRARGAAQGAKRVPAGVSQAHQGIA
ncbi:AAA family ATPase [Tianweitania populi]|uniref:ATPase AAA-type core domain-containing protein n=1 Tax=Tianweitania populi TaxID=1607949 RepID=A0A8J3DR84_9HYPH|nr:AAA family ATPase [Tianweitania populi]GHD13894.1 hypothetical protein GCM10016234_18760 [Tianweitania populi]